MYLYSCADAEPMFNGLLETDEDERERFANILVGILQGHVFHFCERTKRGAVRPCGARSTLYIDDAFDGDGSQRRWYCGSLNSGCFVQAVKTLNMTTSNLRTNCVFPVDFKFPERKKRARKVFCLCQQPPDAGDDEKGGGPMIECSGGETCPGNGWFHRFCLGIESDEWDKLKKEDERLCDMCFVYVDKEPDGVPPVSSKRGRRLE